MLSKENLYRITRLELSGIQLDFAKAGADALLTSGTVKNENTAHLLGEADAVQQHCFLLTDSALANNINGDKAGKILKELHLNPARIIKISKILRGF